MLSVLANRTYRHLFAAQVIALIGTGLMTVSVTIPQAPAIRPRRGFYQDTTQGMRIYLATPRLRGLLALNLVRGRSGIDGVGQSGRPGEGGAGRNGRQRRGRTRLLRRRLHGGGPPAATPARPVARPKDHALVGGNAGCSADRLRSDHGDIRKQSRPVRAFADVGALGDRLLRRDDARRAPAAPVGRRCGPAGRVRRSVRIVSPVLAVDVPACRVTRLVRRDLADRLGARNPDVEWRRAGWPAVEADLVPHQHPELPPDHPHLREQSPDHAQAYVLDDLHPRWP